MDDKSKQTMGQVAILAVQHFFTMMSLTGKTEEEIQALFVDELARFKSRNFENLPKPPK